MKIGKLFKTAVAIVTLCGLAGLAQAQEKKVKDQAEYDLIQAIGKETVAAKKIELLTQWKDKYPESDFKIERQVQMIGAYQQANQAAQMYTAAVDLQKLEANNINAMYWLVALPPSMNVTTPERLAEAEKNAAALTAALPSLPKPANVDQAAFDTQKKAFGDQATKTLVWVATQRKDFAKVESIYVDLLKANPNDANASYELGRAILATKNKDRQVEALYHIGRAAYSDGPGALPADTRKTVQAFFERTVTAYTGSKEDVQMIADKTKASPFPPAGFTIESQMEKMVKQEEKMKAEDPQKYLWFATKRELIGENGPAYFESSVKDSGLPKLKGKVVSALPAAKPKELTLAIMDDSTPEIKLVLDQVLRGAPPVGTVLEFDMAVPKTFAPEPFLVSAEIYTDQITGIAPEMMPAAPGKKGAAAKKGGAAAPKKGAGKKK